MNANFNTWITTATVNDTVCRQQNSATHLHDIETTHTDGRVSPQCRFITRHVCLMCLYTTTCK